MDLGKKISAHVAYSMKKGKIPKNDLMWPSNFEGDGLHLNFLKKTEFFGISSFVIHIIFYGKVANFLNFLI